MAERKQQPQRPRAEAEQGPAQQDPAEGSRTVIEHELARQDEKRKGTTSPPKGRHSDGRLHK